MQPKIDMIGIVTNNFSEMKNFYNQIMNFPIELELESYVEFKSEGVRFAITTNEIMSQATNHASYQKPHTGQSLEFAFRVPTPEEVDSAYNDLIEKGAAPIKPAADMPWGQRAAFFADPDGHIHEVFADLPTN